MTSRGETIIVTGSSGFIGYRTCELFSSTYNVVAFDRPGAPHPPPDADRMDVDLTSEDNVRQALDAVRDRYGNRIASVIHLAAYYDFAGRPSQKYDEITVQGTARLLRLLKPFDVEQFIFSSTMLVHAPIKAGQRINEDSPMAPKWDYPKSKVTTERLIRQEHGHMPIVFLRIAGVYDDMCHSIPISNQIQRIYERALTSHFFPGDLSHGQSFIHVNDTVNLIGRLVEQRRILSPELVLVVGEPTALSYGALQQELAQLIHGKSWTTVRIPKTLAKLGAWMLEKWPFGGDPFIKPWMIDLADDHYDLDISKARSVVGWEPKRTLGSALPGIVAKLKYDPLAWYEENGLTPPRWLKSRGRRPPPRPSLKEKEPLKIPATRYGG